MITVTENAVKHLQELLRDSGKDAASHGLRLLVERGGCAGWQYAMKIDQPAPDDHVVEQSGVRVFVAPDSLSLLENSQVDYEDSLTDAGFKINNPNAARSCGCGTSFEAAEAGKEPSYDPAAQDGSACGDD